MRVLCWDVAVKTLSYCILDQIPEVKTVIEAWETLNVHEEAGLADGAKTTAKEDCEMVLDALGRRRDIFGSQPLDAVIIESQPGSLNNRFSSVKIKVVSHAIHAFFYSFQREVGGMGVDGAVVPVSFVSPSSKLVGMKKETAEDRAARQTGNRTAMGAKYRANKAYAVEKTRELLALMDPDLATTTAARATFEAAARKQDDLADSFMLAYVFCSKTKPQKRKRANAK